MSKIVTGKFEKHKDCGFLIPEKRETNERDYFVSKHNCRGLEDGDRLEAEVLTETTGKRKEVKIIKKLPELVDYSRLETITGLYSSGNKGFGFIDVEGQEKGYFCHDKKRGEAKDGDTVLAKLKNYNGKKEAIVLEVLSKTEEFAVGTFQDHETFGFVICEIEGIRTDVFIPGNQMNEAENGDVVKVNITRKTGKNPQGVVVEILEENTSDDLDFEIK